MIWPFDMRLSADCSRSVHLALQELQALRQYQQYSITMFPCLQENQAFANGSPVCITILSKLGGHTADIPLQRISTRLFRQSDQ